MIFLSNAQSAVTIINKCTKSTLGKILRNTRYLDPIAMADVRGLYHSCYNALYIETTRKTRSTAECQLFSVRNQENKKQPGVMFRCLEGFHSYRVTSSRQYVIHSPVFEAAGEIEQTTSEMLTQPGRRLLLLIGQMRLEQRIMWIW